MNSVATYVFLLLFVGIYCSITGKDLKKVSTFGVANGSFTLNGEPYRFVSGSVHYFRVPHQNWQDRLHKVRLAGFQAVSTYVEWSFHEREEGQYNWEGDQDLVKFIKLAQDEGLFVLLRPGPYICAERDLGGLPYWLLSKYPNIKLRTSDPDYMKEVKKWYKVLFERVSPYLHGNGGPIILVQVENEYGSYSACDKNYMKQLRDITRSYVHKNAVLYTTDGLFYLKCGAVEDTVTTIDFGTGPGVEEKFKIMKKSYPESPPMNSEYYPGWLTHWGEQFQRVSTESVVKSFEEMLTYGANVNFYVMHGGSNFEFTAGANYPPYQLDITSYDYDAPITEAGDITPKYLAIRKTMEKYFKDTKNLPIPVVSPKGSYGKVELNIQLPLMSAKGIATLGVVKSPVVGASLPTFEALNQRAGLVLFQHQLVDSGESEDLVIDELHDYAYVFVDGKYCGSMDRTILLNNPIKISFKKNSQLSILVEHLGRINYGINLTDFKGILGDVRVANKVLAGRWNITGFPLENVETDEVENSNAAAGPILLKGNFVLPTDEQPRDTFLSTGNWTKGFIWVNGHNLGRYWTTKKTQMTLYLPGVYLKAAPEENVIKILEYEQLPQDRTIQFVDKPIFNH